MPYRVPLYKTLAVKQSDIHHRGVYAKRHIKEGERIIRYMGKRLTNKQVDDSDDDTYHFQLNSRYTIDGKNDARYINHSCDPNCESDIIKNVIWIIAIRDIKPGEELTYNYSYDLSEAKRFPCLCKADRCAGYIADEIYWDKLKA